MAQEADVGPVLRAVLGQLDVWWWGAVTMRMAGLTDEEYFWKPVPDAFCLRRDGDALYYEWPPGSQGEAVPPVTTIAWRLSHIAGGCFMNRWHEYFGDRLPDDDWTVEPFPSTAAGALAYLEEWKARWCDALTTAGEARLWEPLGPSPDVPVMQLGRDDPFIGMVLHVHREVMHHGAEICLLRDLYRARTGTISS